MALGSVVLVIACSAGDGEGSATGMVNAPACGIDNEAFDLRPNFFTADPTENFLEIRVQRGSDQEDLSDKLTIFVAEADEVKASRLETPLTIGKAIDSPVRMSLALNRTCPIDRRHGPINLVATSGTITFHSIYFPTGPDEPVTEATFTDVQFDDGWTPVVSSATLSGYFHFNFSRGRPAQFFP
jgi:hypothetical protein